MTFHLRTQSLTVDAVGPMVCRVCSFELPQALMSNPARCYDCESARTRKSGKEPRAGSKAAEAAAAKASGIYVRRELAELRAAKWAAYVESNRERSRQLSRSRPRSGERGRVLRKMYFVEADAAYEKKVCGYVMLATQEKLDRLQAELALIEANTPGITNRPKVDDLNAGTHQVSP